MIFSILTTKNTSDHCGSLDRLKTNFLGNEVPKENMHYTCTACITIDSVMRMDKKTIPRFI